MNPEHGPGSTSQSPPVLSAAGMVSPTSQFPVTAPFPVSLLVSRSPGDCRDEAVMGKSTCCRQKHYISFRELPWAQHWILEPAGFQAFRCSGSCLQVPRSLRLPGSGQRSCAAAGSSALPIIYLVKRGNHTEIEAAEFPNMIVERCSCVTDGAALL